MTSKIRCCYVFNIDNFNFVFNCCMCKKIFRRSEELTKHIEEHFPQAVKEERSFIFSFNCHSCTHVSRTSEESFQHGRIRFAQEDGPFNCYLCTGVFGTSEELTVHFGDHFEAMLRYAESLSTEERNVENQENIVTEQTERSINEADTISEPHVIEVECLTRRSGRSTHKQKENIADSLHEQNHSNASGGNKLRRPNKISALSEKPPHSNAPEEKKCSYCGKIFSTNWDLHRHTRLHNGKRPYQCQSCLKTFARRDNLKTHEKHVHTKDLLHKCTVCENEKGFVTASELGIHNRQKHLAASDPRRFFLCKLCAGKFDTIDKLRYHTSRMHRQNSATFNCAHCRMVFMHRVRLVQHMQIHAGTKNFECKHCHKKFAQQHGKYQHEGKCASK